MSFPLVLSPGVIDSVSCLYAFPVLYHVLFIIPLALPVLASRLPAEYQREDNGTKTIYHGTQLDSRPV
jgi:hypothetical protein